MKIKDAVIVLTGASEGIGLATARVLAKSGAKVVLVARSAEKLAKLSLEIPGSFAVPTDMRNPADIVALVEVVMKKYGRIDILINNAGQGMRETVEKTDIEDYRSIMELNVFSVLRAMQAVIPIMRAQGGGMIINVSSMVSKNYYPMHAAYSSTKYALNSLSLTARAELQADKIVVCVFHPKLTATGFGQSAHGEKVDFAAGLPGMIPDTPEAVAEAIAGQIESQVAEAMM